MYISATVVDMDLMTRREVAEAMRVSTATVDRWARNGIITRRKITGLQSVRYSRSEIMRLSQEAERK